ncbi:hypothetical protein [Longispora albida]|uniref:hypothetical protein n=1 Tax=Longispora albida TaxID=203523 RepID=UPI00037635CC|nr:hypothetical protein [Longispora albida]
MEDEQVRALLSGHVTENEPPFGLTAGTVITAGRRARRVQHGLALAVAVLATVVSVPVAVSLAGGAGTGQAPQVPAQFAAPSTAQAPEGPVVGATGALIDQRVRADLPAGKHPVTVTVYPSDWTTSKPIPDDRAAYATDWHGQWKYTGKKLRVSLMYLWPGARVQGCAAPAKDCTDVQLPDGSRLITYTASMGSAVPMRWVRHHRSDTYEVLAGFEIGQGNGNGLSDEELARIATDPQLVFPAPPVWPSPPS